MSDLHGMPSFWIVWNPMGATGPKVQYPTRKAAQYVAREMAKRHASEGAFFYVLKAQSCHQVQGSLVNFMMAPWGIGAPCHLHHPVGIPKEEKTNGNI